MRGRYLWYSVPVLWATVRIGSVVADSGIGLCAAYLVFWQAWPVVEQSCQPKLGLGHRDGAGREGQLGMVC